MSNMNWNKLKNNDIHVARGTSFGYDELPQVGSFQDQARRGGGKSVIKKPKPIQLLPQIVTNDAESRLQKFKEMLVAVNGKIDENYALVFKLSKVIPAQSLKALTDKNQFKKVLDENFIVDIDFEYKLLSLVESKFIIDIMSIKSWPNDACDIYNNIITKLKFSSSEAAFFIRVIAFSFKIHHIVDPSIKEKCSIEKAKKIKQALESIKASRSEIYVNSHCGNRGLNNFYYKLADRIKRNSRFSCTKINEYEFVFYRSKFMNLNKSIVMNIVNEHKIRVNVEWGHDEIQAARGVFNKFVLGWQMNNECELYLVNRESWIEFDSSANVNWDATIDKLNLLLKSFNKIKDEIEKSITSIKTKINAPLTSKNNQNYVSNTSINIAHEKDVEFFNEFKKEIGKISENRTFATEYSPGKNPAIMFNFIRAHRLMFFVRLENKTDLYICAAHGDSKKSFNNIKTKMREDLFFLLLKIVPDYYSGKIILTKPDNPIVVAKLNYVDGNVFTPIHPDGSINWTKFIENMKEAQQICETLSFDFVMNKKIDLR